MLPGWLNENSYRDYPMQPGADVPQDAVADMGVLIGPLLDQGGFSNSVMRSNFDSAIDDVKLAQLSLSGSNMIYTFKLPNTFASVALTFVCPTTDPPFTTYFANAYQGTNLLWQGWLTTGYRVDTLAALQASSPCNYSSSLLEKARLQNLANRFVSSLNIANYPRTIADAPDGCSGEGSLFITNVGTRASNSSIVVDGRLVEVNGVVMVQAIVSATDIVGDVLFREGYNCSLRMEVSTNSLVISAYPGAGAGPACGEVALDAVEQAILDADDGRTLDGGPLCKEVLTSINGVSVPNFIISAGTGLTVQPSTEQASTLIISASTKDFTTCLS